MPIRTAAPLWGLMVLLGLAMLPSPVVAADATLLFAGIFRGSRIDERVEATVLQRLAETGYSVRRLGAGSPPCQSGDCLATLAGRQSVAFAVVGSVAKTENACTGTVFVSYDVAQKALSKTVACHAEWSEVEVAARVAEDIGALLDEAKRLQRQQQATEQAKTAALSRFNGPLPWQRRLVVGLAGIAFAGLLAGAAVTTALDGRPLCPTTTACDQELANKLRMKTQPLLLDAHDLSKETVSLWVGAAMMGAGLVVSLAIP